MVKVKVNKIMGNWKLDIKVKMHFFQHKSSKYNHNFFTPGGRPNKVLLSANFIAFDTICALRRSLRRGAFDLYPDKAFKN